MSTRNFLDTRAKSLPTQEDQITIEAITETTIEAITDITVTMDIMDIMMVKESSFLIFLSLLTGESKVPLPQLRTKVAVDHAGHSLPLAPWKV